MFIHYNTKTRKALHAVIQQYIITEIDRKLCLMTKESFSFPMITSHPLCSILLPCSVLACTVIDVSHRLLDIWFCRWAPHFLRPEISWSFWPFEVPFETERIPLLPFLPQNKLLLKRFVLYLFESLFLVQCTCRGCSVTFMYLWKFMKAFHSQFESLNHMTDI